MSAITRRIEELQSEIEWHKKVIETRKIDIEALTILKRKQDKCEHVWDNIALIAREEEGGDLSEYDATCELCQVRYSEVV